MSEYGLTKKEFEYMVETTFKVSFDRLRELAEKDAEGRVKIIPFIPGTKFAQDEDSKYDIVFSGEIAYMATCNEDTEFFTEGDYADFASLQSPIPDTKAARAERAEAREKAAENEAIRTVFYDMSDGKPALLLKEGICRYCQHNDSERIRCASCFENGNFDLRDNLRGKPQDGGKE